MSEFKKALKYLRAVKADAMKNGDSFIGTNNMPSINIAIHALNKQISKKPVITRHFYTFQGKEDSYELKHCPVCFNDPKCGYFESLPNKGDKYCNRCGQALDWSEE